MWPITPQVPTINFPFLLIFNILLLMVADCRLKVISWNLRQTRKYSISKSLFIALCVAHEGENIVFIRMASPATLPHRKTWPASPSPHCTENESQCVSSSCEQRGVLIPFLFAFLVSPVCRSSFSIFPFFSCVITAALSSVGRLFRSVRTYYQHPGILNISELK